MQIQHHNLNIETQKGISIFDITAQVNACVQEAEISQGFVVVCSHHTTTALTINEHENRLLEGIRSFFLQLVPPHGHYLHNDIHLRECPPEEPENAHAHLVAMMLGASEAIPVVDGQLDLGQYQSLMLVELDGPRTRSVKVQVMGE